MMSGGVEAGEAAIAFAVRSTLVRGVAEGDAELSRFAVSIVALLELFLPQNDNSPPPVLFFPISLSDLFSSSAPTTLHPTGISTPDISSGLALTLASHANDPLLAINCDIGLERVSGMFRDSFKASERDFEVWVWRKGGMKGSCGSSGANRAARAVLWLY